MTKEKARLFDTVLFLEPKLEQRLWPVHCIMNSWGSQLHERLFIAPNSQQVHFISIKMMIHYLIIKKLFNSSVL